MSQKSYPVSPRMIWGVVRAQRGYPLTFNGWHKGALIYLCEGLLDSFSVYLHWHADPEGTLCLGNRLQMNEFEHICERPQEFAGTTLEFYCWQDNHTTSFTLASDGEWVEYGFDGKESDQ